MNAARGLTTADRTRQILEDLEAVRENLVDQRLAGPGRDGIIIHPQGKVICIINSCGPAICIDPLAGIRSARRQVVADERSGRLSGQADDPGAHVIPG